MGVPTTTRRGPVERILDQQADALFDFALAVTHRPETAAAAVRDGVAEAIERHGSEPGRAALLGRVLDAAVPRADPVGLPSGGGPGADPAAGAALPGVEELRRVSRESTRALEPRTRGVVDLALRQGLDGEALAEALGVAPGQARTAADAALEQAAQVVGALLLARVGAEPCAGLAAVLDRHRPAPEPGRLAADVAEHLERCPPCGDRRRAFVPVSSLLAAVPATPAPRELRRVGAAPRSGRRPGWRAPPGRPGTRVVAAALAVGVLVAVVAVVARRDDTAEPARNIVGGQLVLSVAGGGDRAVLDFGPAAGEASFEVHNPGALPLRFRAEPAVPWLSVVGGAGEVPPGGVVAVQALLDRSRAPEGETTTKVRVTSTGGSGVVAVRAAVGRAPVLSGIQTTPDPAVAANCPGTTPTQVRVRVVEESGTEEVLLHWRIPGSGESAVPMLAEEQSSYAVSVGPFPAPVDITWWISARDVRGNTTASAPEVLRVSGC